MIMPTTYQRCIKYAFVETKKEDTKEVEIQRVPRTGPFILSVSTDVEFELTQVDD